VLAPGQKGCSPLLKIAAACAAPAAIDELVFGLVERFLYPAVQPIHVARFRRAECAAAGCASQAEAVSVQTLDITDGLPCCGGGTGGQAAGPCHVAGSETVNEQSDRAEGFRCLIIDA